MTPSEERPDASGARALLRSALLDFAVIWIVGLGVRRSLFALINGALWPFPPLPWFEKIGLVAFGFVGGTPSVVLIALAFTAVRASLRVAPPARWLGAGLAWTLVFAMQVFMFASWGSYYSTSEFLNADLLTLAASSPKLLFEHIVQLQPAAFVAVPGAAALYLAVSWRVSDWVHRWPLAYRRWIVRGVVLLLVTSTIVAGIADAIATREAARSPEVASNAFLNVAVERSGPTVRILADLLHVLSRKEGRLSALGERSTPPRPVITAAEYARRAQAGGMRRWNVIVVIVESMRADALVALGGRRLVMPRLEALARGNVLYARAQTAASHSDYATTSALASQYPLRHDEVLEFKPPFRYPRVLLWDVFKSVGYRTAVFSSQNEHWAGMYDFLQTGGVEHFLHAETYKGPTYADPSDQGFFHWMKEAGRAGKIDDHDTIDEAIAWLDSIAPGAPYVSYVNLQSSHIPYTRPSSFPPRFGTGRLSFHVNFGKYPADSAGAVRDMYDNALAYADVQIGRLLDAVRQRGQWDSTVIVVVGDHGEGFYEHGFGAHGGSLFQEVTHVPIVMHVPGERARVDSLPASAVDILPTVLGALAMPPHPAFQGIDLADTTARRGRPIFTLAQTGLATEVAVEQDGWKLRFNLYHGDVQLFDLTHDPLEAHDVGDVYPVQRHALMLTVGLWWSAQLRYYGHLPDVPKVYAPVLGRRPALAPP